MVCRTRLGPNVTSKARIDQATEVSRAGKAVKEKGGPSGRTPDPRDGTAVGSVISWKSLSLTFFFLNILPDSDSFSWSGLRLSSLNHDSLFLADSSPSLIFSLLTFSTSEFLPGCDFPSIHIVGSLASKLPSIICLFISIISLCFHYVLHVFPLISLLFPYCFPI